MAGIYIHIPFCRQACHYCDFHFSVNQDTSPQITDAIIREISLQKNYLPDETIQTIYFGGGTPSLLDQKELARILDKLFKEFRIAADAEISMEANPDDLTEKKIAELRQLSINRLSIGVQSFEDADLRWMNRAHDARQAVRSVRSAQEAGFTNISIDLIYGLPESRQETWQANIQKALDLGVQHLSCYCLTVEPRTALAHFIATAKTKPVDDELAAQQFERLMLKLCEAGWKHYEVSNFAVSDRYISRHNSAYWQGEKYLGLGPSAHSFSGHARQWNVSDNHQYLQSIHNSIVPFESENLTNVQRTNERIMTLLRTSWGLNLSVFDPDVSKLIAERSEKFIKQGLAGYEEQRLTLTEKGWMIADRIILDLMLDE